MPGRLGSAPEGPAQTGDAIQAFCRHLGELCDVLSAPYDAESLAQVSGSQELQATNCNVLLHKALYQWLGERVELSMTDEGSPEEAARRTRCSALARIQDQDMLSEFVQTVATACANPGALAEVAPERGKPSLLFDLQGPIDLLGPEEVDSLLSELASSDRPLSALESLSSDVHLLEDLCFGPTWPQLCDALGRLACRPAAVLAPVQPVVAAAPALPRQQQLLLDVLQEVLTSVASSSPPHAAELLDALAPYLTALVLRLVLPPPYGGSSGLLAAASALDPFAVGLTRVLQQLLTGLAAEFHTLPSGCAALAARAVCDVVRAGLARGAPAAEVDAAADAATVADLSALDLLVLLDPELRWWQRLCAATHATQSLADAAAVTQMPAALEAALQAWATSAGAAGSSGGAATGGMSGTAAGGRSPTHLLACTALLGGLVRANNAALLGVGEPQEADGAGVTGRDAAAPLPAAAAVAAPSLAALAPAMPVSAATRHQQRMRLQRLLGHLLSCFCAVSDKPRLFRPGGESAATPAAEANRVSCSSGGGVSTGGGSVFLLLTADVLSSAAELGTLSLLAPTGGGASGIGGGLTPLLQATLRAAAVTASVAFGAAGASGAVAAAEVKTWLAAAARVLDAATDNVVLSAFAFATTDSQPSCTAVAAAKAKASAAPQPRESPGPPAAADAMCGLLRHIAGRVRGCAAAAASAAPGWAVAVVRAAAPLSAASPAVAAALHDLYGTLHAVLSARAAARAAAAGGGGGARVSGGGSQQTLLAILEGSATLGAEQGRASGSKNQDRGSSSKTDELDELEALAAEAVISCCCTEFGNGGQSAVGARAARGSLQVTQQQLVPASLRRPLFLECAARLLCEEYDIAGGVEPGRGGGGGGGARKDGRGIGVRRTAAKRRVAQRAQALARCCMEGQQALMATGFARRVLDDVAAVLRSGEYESPYLEPLPYADQLTGLSTVLEGVLCWPGLLRLPQQEEAAAGQEEPLHQQHGDNGTSQRQENVGAGGLCPSPSSAPSPSLEQRHRREVLAALQELVTWLDVRGAEGGGLPPADAAAVSLGAFSALLAADPSAGAALERDTNIRWYLQSLCGTLPPGGGAGGGGGGGSHSDMVMDMARGVLRAVSDGPSGASAIATAAGSASWFAVSR